MTMQEFTPIQYLQIDIASQYGLDKSSWDERIEWTYDNETDLEGLLEEAEEPALYFAAVQAYRAAQAGEPISYGISLDATASGAQILSLLIGCEASARLCNVIDTGNREDFYTNVYDAWVAMTGCEKGIGRPDMKRAVMTSLYGSKAEPRAVFGEGELLDCFYDTMNQEAPGAWKLNEELLALWDPTASIYEWTLPDNFNVKVKVMDDEMETFSFLGQRHEAFFKVNRPTDEGRSLGANLVHSVDGMIVREILRRCSHDPQHMAQLSASIYAGTYASAPKLNRPKDRLVKTLWAHYQETGFLSARILESLDEDNLMVVDTAVIWKLLKSLPEKPFPVLSIHDCFRVHPRYANDLRRQYNGILSEIAGSSILQSAARQFTRQGEQLTVTKHGDLTEQALQANYALS